MRLFAISDLHLSLGTDKPMDVFGPLWEGHHEKIRKEWAKRVGTGDTVILGGDLSWALKLEEAVEDFQFIHHLPGTKVLFKGNHDYWWKSLSQVKKVLPDSMVAVQNSYYPFYGTGRPIALCGTRGWSTPGGESFTSQDEKIYRRELGRLELSLQSAFREGFRCLVVTLHYPPLSPGREGSGFTKLMQDYGVKICLYGHLHGDDQFRAIAGERDGIRYYFIAADFLAFAPLEVDLAVFAEASLE